MSKGNSINSRISQNDLTLYVLTINYLQCGRPNNIGSQNTN